jgi:hypothetical protein
METKEFLESLLKKESNNFTKPNNPIKVRMAARKSNISGPKLEQRNEKEKMELHLAQAFLAMVEKFNNNPVGRYPDLETQKIMGRIDETLPILLENIGYRHTDNEEEEEGDNEESIEEEEPKRNPRRLRI